jgi:hypothetical protein
VALLAHSREWKTVCGYPKRVMDQFHFAQREFGKMGMKARLVTEDDVGIDRHGSLRFVKDGRRVDLLMFVTVGTSFMDEPELLRKGGALAHFTQPRIGETWVLKPLAGLVVDKGALPLLGSLRATRRMQDGFRFEISPTEFPIDRQRSRYLRRPEDWVIKCAFDGKDTKPGIGCGEEEWTDVVDFASRGYEYVAQRYVSMPRTDIPVLVDERHLEWVPSRVELSPFIYDGAFGGAGVRHAPEGEGLVMTDFPRGYGYTSAFSV